MQATLSLGFFLLVSFVTGSFRPTLKMTLVKERFAEIEYVLPKVDMPFSVHYCQFSDIKSPPWVSC